MRQQVFTTDRLYVRRLASADIDVFYEMQSDADVMRYVKPAMTYEESVAELQRFIAYYDSDRFYYIWAVAELESQAFVGICGVYLNEKGEYEIAYRLLQRSWGVGYGKEIAAGLLRYCFDDLQLNTLVGYAYEGNKGSIRILQKLMTFVSKEMENGQALWKFFVSQS